MLGAVSSSPAGPIVYITSGVVGYTNRFLPIGRELRRRGHAVSVLSPSLATVAAAEQEGLDAVHLVAQAATTAALPPQPSWPGPIGRLARFVPGVALGPRRAAREHWRARAAAMSDANELLDLLARLQPPLVLTEAEEHRDIRVVLGAGYRLALFEDLYATRPDPGVPFPARSHHVPTGTRIDRLRAAARWQRFFAVEAVRRRAERWWVDGADWHSTLASLCDPEVLAAAGTSRRYLQFYDYRQLPHLRTVAPELAFPGERARPTITGPVVDTERLPHGIDERFTERWPALQAHREAGGRLVYVTLGTFLQGLEELTATVLEGCAGIDGVRVVASVGADADRWRDRVVPAGVDVFGRVPQIEVLAGCDAVVSTGGLNTGHEAVWFGVPVLNIPVAGVDTAGNAARAVHHGVGERLRRGEVSAEAVRASITRLLDDPSYRQRATAIGAGLRARDGVRGAADAVEALIG